MNKMDVCCSTDHPQIQQEDKTFVSMEMLYINPSEKVVTVKCIVRHPALSHKTLMDFVKVTPRRKYNSSKSH